MIVLTLINLTFICHNFFIVYSIITSLNIIFNKSKLNKLMHYYHAIFNKIIFTITIIIILL